MSPDERDTAVTRGQAVDEDRWSPGGPPPAPGWYEDPWNANNLRRWDGGQWTGETASKSSGPPAPEPEPEPEPIDHPAQPTSSAAAPSWEPTPAAAAPWEPAPAAAAAREPAPASAAAWEPAPAAAAPSEPTPASPAPWEAAPAAAPSPPAGRRRRLPNPFLIVGIVAAVGVVAAVVITSGHSGSSNTTTPLAPPAPSASTAPLGLPASALTDVDLGAGWTASPPAHAMTAAEYTAGPCGSALWAHNVGGYESAFVKGASAATAHGAAVSKIVEAPTLATADQEWSLIAAPAFATCLQSSVTAEVRSQLAPGSGQSVTGSTVSPFSLGLSVPSRAFLVSVTVTGPGAVTRQVTDYSVAISTSRYIARLDVSWSSDAPLGAQIVQEQAANEASHLAALG